MVTYLIVMHLCYVWAPGGTGLSSMDGVLIYEELAYGCTGIVSPIVANDLAVSV